MKVKNKGLSLLAAILLALAMAVTPLSLAQADDDGTSKEDVPSAVVEETIDSDAADEAATEAAAQAAAEAQAAEEQAEAEKTEEAAQAAPDETDTADAAAQAAAEAEKAEEAAQAAPDETAAATEGDTTATDADAATGGEGETIYPLPSVTTSFDGPGKGSVTFVFQNPNENQQWFSAWLTPGAGVEVDCATIDLSHQGSVCGTSVLRTAITVPGQSSGTLVVPLNLTGYGPWVVNVTTYDPWGETGVEGPLTIRSNPGQASSFIVTGEVEDGQIIARFDFTQEWADAAYFNWGINPQEGVTWTDCTAATHVYACGASGASGDIWAAAGQPVAVALVADAEPGAMTVSGWVQRPGLSIQEPWTFTVQVPEVTPPTTSPDPSTPSSPTTPVTPDPSTPPSSPTSPEPTTTAPAPSPDRDRADHDRHYYSGGTDWDRHYSGEEGGAAAEQSSADATASGDEAGAPASSQLTLPQTGGPGTGPGSALLALAVTAAAAVACCADVFFSFIAKLKKTK